MTIEKRYTITDTYIGIFDNFFPDALLDRYIQHFKALEDAGMTFGREEHEHHEIVDSSIALSFDNFYQEVAIPYVQKEFNQIFFNEVYPLYMKEFSMLSGYERHGIIDIKVQKTLPGQGYHGWHCEDSAARYRNRITAFGLYLNDVEEGGETEFLHQKTRYKPIKNRMLVWPSTYTHAHRGNQPLSGEKYLLTGWTEFIP
mgnify:FL=1|jgi:hypothetical protein|tara:strand:- start:102 stop:701 length:600 start_codon:yes stop_codon:yes gene_type:complete